MYIVLTPSDEIFMQLDTRTTELNYTVREDCRRTVTDEY